MYSADRGMKIVINEKELERACGKRAKGYTKQ